MQVALVSSVGSQDNFPFAPNFGQAIIGHFPPTTDIIEFSNKVFANINALLNATHDDTLGTPS
jgi:hypothetical protein